MTCGVNTPNPGPKFLSVCNLSLPPTMQGLRAQRRRTPAQGALASQAFRLGNKWAGWGLIPILFPLAWQVARVSSTRDVPFPPRRPGEYRKGMLPARPLYQGVRGSVWDPEPSRERVGNWGGPGRSGPSCVLPKGVPQGQLESGGIVLAAICWATSAQRRCHPQEALYLPTSSHLFDSQ